MKKVLLVIISILILASFGGTCFADNPVCPPRCPSDDMCTRIKELDNVKDCRIICFKGYCFVALRTQGVASKNAMDELTEKVTNIVKECCPRVRNVFVTTSVKAFSQMENLTEKRMWEQLIKLFGLDANKYPLPGPKPMPFEELPDNTQSETTTAWKKVK
jgi:hypothetical protein